MASSSSSSSTVLLIVAGDGSELMVGLLFFAVFLFPCCTEVLQDSCSSFFIPGRSRAPIIQPLSFKPSENVCSQGEDEVLPGDNFGRIKVDVSNAGTSLLAKLGIALGLAATVTAVSLCVKKPSSASASGVAYLLDASNASVVTSRGFTFNLFNQTVILPEYPPGWVYFWLLMAAGCGLFISEEALIIWIGISMARLLAWDGTWQTFVESFSSNASYIISTVLWVYWGVCISDTIPFYLGKLFRESKASEDVSTKLGIGKEKMKSITEAVQKYGNLMGFVERFSMGVRNPTSFIAGMLGIWTAFPYLVAASTALFFFPLSQSQYMTSFISDYIQLLVG